MLCVLLGVNPTAMGGAAEDPHPDRTSKTKTMNAESDPALAARFTIPPGPTEVLKLSPRRKGHTPLVKLVTQVTQVLPFVHEF